MNSYQKVESEGDIHMYVFSMSLNDVLKDSFN